MDQTVISNWHTIVRTGDVEPARRSACRPCVFYSPVVHTPQIGKAITAKYLAAAVDVFGNESFRYVREIKGESDAVPRV